MMYRRKLSKCINPYLNESCFDVTVVFLLQNWLFEICLANIGIAYEYARDAFIQDPSSLREWFSAISDTDPLGQILSIIQSTCPKPPCVRCSGGRFLCCSWIWLKELNKEARAAATEKQDRGCYEQTNWIDLCRQVSPGEVAYSCWL